MLTKTGMFRLELLGPLRLFAPDGRRIDVSSRKGMALLALLATAPSGERTRSWLQDHLWGSRASEQAQGSLRRELANLRRLLDFGTEPVLTSDRDRVALDTNRMSIDIRDDIGGTAPTSEFLEGLDLPDEEAFEDWLRDQRGLFRERPAIWEQGTTPTQTLPARVVDLSQPTPGFEGRPSLAILPFDPSSDDPASAYLIEGIGEDLIDRLSRLRWLPIIARGSSFAFDPRNIDHRGVSRALGADYLLEGKVRRQTGGDSITLTLSEAALRRVVWTKRFKLTDGVTGALDDVLDEIVGALEARIAHEHQVKAITKPASDLKVADLIWRGRWHLNRFTREDAAAARALFADALAREPDSPEALIQSTWSLAWSIWAKRRSDDKVREMRRMAARAILADHQDGRGHLLAGIAECWLRNPTASRGLLQTAIDLNPSLFFAHAQLGSTLYLCDEPLAAIESLKTALRLSANDQQVFYVLGELAMAHVMLGNWDAAIDHADQSILRRPAYWYAHVVRIAALAHKGSAKGAKQGWKGLIEASPGFLPSYTDWLPFIDARWPEFLKRAIAHAADGIPLQT